MKIRRKIIFMEMAVLVISFLICGFFSVNQYMTVSIQRLAENELEKLEVSQWALKQVGTREDLEKMGVLARDSYLKFQFKRCYKEGYALMNQKICLSNLTGYEIIDVSALNGEYTVQQLGENYLLLVYQKLEYPEKFWVMAVKDITDAWTDARKQILVFISVFLCTFGVAVTVSVYLTGRMLSVFHKLKMQAEAISCGDFSVKAEVKTRDELAELAESINRMSIKIQQQIEDLQLLSGAMAHEMKTPVTSIMGYADTLLHVRLSREKQEQALQAIFRSADRLNRLSGKLMQLIGLYENQELELECLCMGEILDTCCIRMKDLISEKPPKISMILNIQEDFCVTGDRLLLEALFENLLSNSKKALDAGGIIRINCLKNVVEVEDNGCGISEKDLPHVCKPFYMSDKARSRKKQGCGLGLALAERIVMLHAAQMTIESQLGKGTRIRITWKSNEEDA